ncbi:hypothetical protein [Sporichthya polymorpha]|uniref:hypothetical protein n=1 Tax=Sporichthya polymorpha TaxID=35751 RepID=UPI00037EAA42|nr:hypothetical protein [Sporichthya polymorpha]
MGAQQTWRWPSKRRGNFNFRALACTYEFAARDAYLDREYFGLSPMGTYFFACLNDTEGNFVAPIRKVVTELSGGLQLSSNVGEENMEIAPEAFLASHRGVGVKWNLAEDEKSFVIAAAETPYSRPFRIEIRDDGFSWTEGDLLSIEGRRLRLGYQWYTPNIDERGGNFYAAQSFEATGTVQGRSVRGYMSMDSFYGPIGQVYNNGPIFNAVEQAWVAFVNFYDDGSYETGGLCIGKEHWGFGVVSDQDGPIVESNRADAEVHLDADGYVKVARYFVEDTEWEFTAVERGQMRSMAKARGDAYHGQAGSVRRVGDTRTPVSSTAWIETMPLNGLDRRR